MDRRSFNKLFAAACAAVSGVRHGRSKSLLAQASASAVSPGQSATIPDTRRVFWKIGACSHTFFYLLNREFGHLKEAEERASNPLSGGLMQTGHQCGMLWGSTLAVGAESFRRRGDCGQAIGVAMTAAQHIVESFSKRANTVNCRDITGCDFANKLDVARVILKAVFSGVIPCFVLADIWAPEAIRSAREGLSDKRTDLPQVPVSCASEVARRMGASNEEMVIVAGLAGGIGLSGNACGALGAAIWMNTLAWNRKHPGKSGLSNPNAKSTLKAFYDATGSEIICSKICGQHFETVADHTTFVKDGGCNKVLTVLARS